MDVNDIPDFKKCAKKLTLCLKILAISPNAEMAKLITI